MCDIQAHVAQCAYNASTNNGRQQSKVDAVVRRYEQEWARWQQWQLRGRSDAVPVASARQQMEHIATSTTHAAAPQQQQQQPAAVREGIWRVVPRLVHRVLPAAWLRRWRRQQRQGQQQQQQQSKHGRHATPQRAKKSHTAGSYAKTPPTVAGQQVPYSLTYDVPDMYEAAAESMPAYCGSAWEQPLPPSFCRAMREEELCSDRKEQRTPCGETCHMPSSSPRDTCTPCLPRHIASSSSSFVSTHETPRTQQTACTTAEALERLACSLRRVAELQMRAACDELPREEDNMHGKEGQGTTAGHDVHADEAMREAQMQLTSGSSLVRDAVHTPHDRAVRRAYDEVVGGYCTEVVRAAVQRALGRARGATNRALSELLLHTTLDAMRARRAGAASSTTERTGVRFSGILRHIQSGQLAAVDALELDEEDHAVLRTVEQGRVSRGEQTAITFATAGYAISFAQLATLRAQCWLNDQVINNYLQLLCETMRQAGTAEAVASLGTHFYAKVQSEVTALRPRREQDRARSSHYAALPAGSALLRWLRRRRHLLMPYDTHKTSAQEARDGDVTTVRVVLIPVNLHDQHWALVVWDKERQRLTYYDSFLGVHRTHGASRARCILAELKHVLCECARHLLASSVQTTQHEPRDAPHRALCHMRCVVAEPYTPRRTSWADLTPYTSIEALCSAADAQHERQRRNAASHRHSSRSSNTGDGSNSSDDDDDAVFAEYDGAEHEGRVEWFSAGDAKMPQQKNGNDCGVFVCQAAWCAAQGVAVSFSQSDVATLRQVILLELWAKKLLRRLPGIHSSSSIDVCM